MGDYCFPDAGRIGPKIFDHGTHRVLKDRYYKFYIWVVTGSAILAMSGLKQNILFPNNCFTFPDKGAHK